MVLGDAAWFPSWEEFNKILNYEEKSDYQKVVEGLVPLGKSLANGDRVSAGHSSHLLFIRAGKSEIAETLRV